MILIMLILKYRFVFVSHVCTKFQNTTNALIHCVSCGFQTLFLVKQMKIVHFCFVGCCSNQSMKFFAEPLFNKNISGSDSRRNTSRAIEAKRSGSVSINQYCFLCNCLGGCSISDELTALLIFSALLIPAFIIASTNLRKYMHILRELPEISGLSKSLRS